MPDFTPEDIDIEPYEFVSACNTREIKELIESLIENGHLPESVLNHAKGSDEKRGRLESEFIDKLDKLKDKFYSLSVEEEDSIEKIFKKHL
jgi:hypothetical protein